MCAWNKSITIPNVQPRWVIKIYKVYKLKCHPSNIFNQEKQERVLRNCQRNIYLSYFALETWIWNASSWMSVEVVRGDKINKEKCHRVGKWTEDRGLMKISPAGCWRQWVKLRKAKEEPGKPEMNRTCSQQITRGKASLTLGFGAPETRKRWPFPRIWASQRNIFPWLRRLSWHFDVPSQGLSFNRLNEEIRVAQCDLCVCAWN